VRLGLDVYPDHLKPCKVVAVASAAPARKCVEDSRHSSPPLFWLHSAPTANRTRLDSPERGCVADRLRPLAATGRDASYGFAAFLATAAMSSVHDAQTFVNGTMIDRFTISRHSGQTASLAVGSSCSIRGVKRSRASRFESVNRIIPLSLPE